MIISLTEFKTDLDRYLELVEKENAVITITKDGKSIATLSPVTKGSIIRSLVGTLPPTVTIEEARAERPAKHETGF